MVGSTIATGANAYFGHSDLRDGHHTAAAMCLNACTLLTLDLALYRKVAASIGTPMTNRTSVLLDLDNTATT